MVRIVKAPDDRKREILDTAMQLFAERGFHATSLRDIAKHMGITPGLVYHYFDSKQKLFDEAMATYVEDLTAEFVRTLRSTDLDFRQKIEALYEGVANEEPLRYRDFFHRQGNEGFHRQLALQLCAHVQPHLVAALEQARRREGLAVRDPETLASFLLYGHVGIMSAHEDIDEKKLARLREYVETLLKSQVEASPPQ
ncbi:MULTISPECIES: TetR/AcrR family transcriptional regulator [Gordonibacter]|uniref:TetR/AcrR family transcriptional regulator n=1 Tax=Gordonibacter faecis TaxID=3047475 RepID=A0ABT7DJX1_9ACTN|nr:MULTISPECIES: TetR/AcrR family transcriptional regulator [unclassified Gordonibacter]MDJ1649824.1 TetR/AcrR family transcriptional regulator [Gordonibacter sp. KGMB12511]HIW75489.1 TetR/AcrR family transcriptional regulator [Candidatus Gordonibacter avicola]